MKLLILGLGYSAGFFARAALARGWEVTGTVRSAERAAELSREGIRTLVFGGFAVSTALAKAVAEAEAVLVSVQPAEDGDPVLQRLRGDLAAAPALRWIGYLSTIGVYGNQDGAWIDETQPVKPGNARNTLRVAVEQDWLALGRDTGKAVLKPELLPVLDSVARALSQHPELRAKAIGYTDSTGTDAINVPLSQRRASAVTQHLAGQGVAADRLTAEGRGAANPVGDNATAEGRALNRRVELFLYAVK